MNSVAFSAVLAWRYLWARPLVTCLNVLMLSLGLASLTFLLLVTSQVEQAFERDLRGIDLVVGAKGSPLQLILSGVFHVEVPSGNIPLAEVQKLAAHPLVAKAIPLSMGDSFQGYRIVGASSDYLELYGARVALGRVWQSPMEVVLGAQTVATLAGGAEVLGRQFAGAHGLGAGGHAHDQRLFTVVGTLAPCGCVLDRLILTANESVWAVHDKPRHTEHDGHDHSHEKPGADSPPREVTVALLRYKSPLAAVSLPRWVNGSTALQAAAPAVEVARLFRLLGVGADVMKGFGWVLVLTAGLSVFIALWHAVHERRGDLAMLRMLGAPPSRLAWLVVCEALWLAVLALVFGMVLGHGLMAVVAQAMANQKSLAMASWFGVPAEAGLAVLVLGVAVAAALLPAATAYRTDVGDLLSRD